MPITLQGFNNVAWARTLNTTLADYLREEEKAILRNYQMLALLESQGRTVMNVGGEGFVWEVQFDVHAVEGNTGETIRQFNRRNLWKNANLDYRGYQVTDAISNRELLANRGQAAVVNVFNRFMERLTESMKLGLATEPYVDGNASGNETSWHGLESMFSVNGTLNVSDGTQRSTNAADLVGYPNDTYAGISTALGTYGGDNETGAVWPDGIADPSFDFWTPLIVQYVSTAFNGSADTWAAQGDEAMRYAIIHSQRNTLADGQPTNVFLTRNLYRQFLDLIDSKEQINVMRNEATGLVALGFKNVVNFDGVDVSWEAAIPTGVGYGLNIKAIELRSMHPQLFVPEGPEYDLVQQQHLAVVSTLSNLRFRSPRGFFKLDDFA